MNKKLGETYGSPQTPLPEHGLLNPLFFSMQFYFYVAPHQNCWFFRLYQKLLLKDAGGEERRDG